MFVPKVRLFPLFYWSVNFTLTNKHGAKNLKGLIHSWLSRAPPFVESTSSCPKYLQLSRTPSVGSISVSQEREQLSKVPSVVEGTSNSRKYLRLPGAVIRSTSSCRGDLHQSEVSPSARSTSSCPKYLHLSRAPPVVQSTFSCRE